MSREPYWEYTAPAGSVEQMLEAVEQSMTPWHFGIGHDGPDGCGYLFRATRAKAQRIASGMDQMLGGHGSLDIFADRSCHADETGSAE